MAAGLSMFAMGLAKKVLIADNLAPISQAVFDNRTRSSLRWCPRGSARWPTPSSSTSIFPPIPTWRSASRSMFNVQFPLNFNSPYKATDISDFWRRWHMTLSHFLRDHLYIPLGGNRHGEPRRLVNLMLTMLLGGLWHGAAWTFVIWGALHGLYLVVHHTWQRSTKNFAWTQRAGMSGAELDINFASPSSSAGFSSARIRFRNHIDIS